MAKLKNTNTNNGETHNTQIKYWRNPQSSVILTTFFEFILGENSKPVGEAQNQEHPMAKLKNANTNNGETHNTQTKYWRNPKS
jgi:hypothetical protein